MRGGAALEADVHLHVVAGDVQHDEEAEEGYAQTSPGGNIDGGEEEEKAGGD